MKLIIAGDGGVGKVQLVQKYVTGIFKNDARITIGVEFFIKDMYVEGFGSIRLQCWDFGGEERFRFLLPTYLKGVNGILFLFSLTDMLTLSNFDDWLPILRNYDPHIPILLVGTKVELKGQRTVQQHEAVDIARSRGCAGYVEIGIEEGINVDATFNTIAKLMLHHEYGVKFGTPRDLSDIPDDTKKQKKKAIQKQCPFCGKYFGVPGYYSHIKAYYRRKKKKKR